MIETLGSEVLSNASIAGNDVTILERMIQSEQKKERGLERARGFAIGIGLLVVGFLTYWGMSTSVYWITIMLGIATSGIVGAYVWVISASLGSSHSTVDQLTSIKDGIELYCPKEPSCVQFRSKLENILKAGAGIQGVLR
jgi:hypothetical protein